MANILDRYGIKEVADVVFYDINETTGNPSNPVLYLDTLKVSTIEQTAEEAEARGGKGNAALIGWDYGKEITVTLEDALFSAKSMAIMFGNGKVKEFDSTEAHPNVRNTSFIMKTVLITTDKDGNDPNAIVATVGKEENAKEYNMVKWVGPDGRVRKGANPLYFDVNGNRVDTMEAYTKYFCTFDLQAEGAIIEVSANSFPGTYYVVGDTFARSETSGKDEMFQFIIPKAKVTSENTITLEAEGDPSVFNMNLKVLRPADGVMMRLVKYQLGEGDEQAVGDTNLIHNHVIYDTYNPDSNANTP